MRYRKFAALLVTSLSIAGCRNRDTIRSGSVRADARAAPTASTPASPESALAAMDTRTPLPLLPMMANHQKQNMREHLMAIEEITAGIVAADFSKIERGAGRIGFSEQMGAMCTHMGAAAPGFTELALAFHHTADGITEAAKRHDMAAVLAKVNETLNACTSCHAAYKQQVVDDATWASLTKEGNLH